MAYTETNALYDRVFNRFENEDLISKAEVLQMIANAPAADVKKVVRCKDCKDYSSAMFAGEPMHYGYCCNTHDSVIGNRHRYEGDFCSYGVKKEGAEE